MKFRLNDQSTLPAKVQGPQFDRQAGAVGIVHLGPGAFHRAHQAVYTDDALAGGGDPHWRIAGVSLRSNGLAAELSEQDNLFTVLSRGVGDDRARVIGSVAQTLAYNKKPQAVMDLLCAPETRIVSLTVTEKAYGFDAVARDVDTGHPANRADLANPTQPVGVAGLLVEGLRRRRANGVAPFTVLCCDNLAENGTVLRDLLVGFARRAAPKIADHIANDVAFPSTMVDRITPAPDDKSAALVAKLTGYDDRAAVVCEDFRQWVIEDNFPTGRPAWEAGGTLFVQDVRPYEAMKLRMLNGAHSMLAYSGALVGHKYVREVMGDPALARLVNRHIRAAAATLRPLSGIDLEAYGDALIDRFRNPHLDHETRQIAMDGSQKMPQRIFAAASDAIANGQDVGPFAFATAAWICYTMGRADDGGAFHVVDPRADDLAFSENLSAEEIVDQFHALQNLAPAKLNSKSAWKQSIAGYLRQILGSGMRAVIDGEGR